jgi:hypothetical protein
LAEKTIPGPPNSAIKEDFPIDGLASGEIFCEKMNGDRIRNRPVVIAYFLITKSLGW